MERKATPPSTPPWAMTGGALSNKSNSTLPTTPPAIRKYSTGNLKVESALIKSTSHESQLGHKLTHPSASDLALVGSYLPVSAASNCENPPMMCGDQSRPMVSSSMASSITSNLNSAVYRYIFSKVKLTLVISITFEFSRQKLDAKLLENGTFQSLPNLK